MAVPEERYPVRKYPMVLRALHWIIACLVLATWPLGFILDSIKDEVKLDFYLVHESLGFLVLWLMLLRVGARLASSVPVIEGGKAERIAAHSVHGLLYVFLIIMPVSGFLATNAYGFPLQWFGLIEIWSPVGKSPEIAPVFSAIHARSAWIILGLLALHFLAAIFHHVIRRDTTLYRML